MEKSIVARKIASKKALGMKSPRFYYDALQPGGALDMRLNHDKPHWTKPVTASVVACKLCQWDSGENIIAQVQCCIL